VIADRRRPVPARRRPFTTAARCDQTRDDTDHVTRPHTILVGSMRQGGQIAMDTPNWTTSARSGPHAPRS